MIKSFANKHTADLFFTGKSRRLPPDATTMTLRRKRQRRPIHPGEFLREDFLPDYDLSVADLAAAIKVSRQTVNELINEKRALSAAMALRLSRFFGNTPEFWLNAQRELDLWEAERLHKAELKQIKPASAA